MPPRLITTFAGDPPTRVVWVGPDALVVEQRDVDAMGAECWRPVEDPAVERTWLDRALIWLQGEREKLESDVAGLGESYVAMSDRRREQDNAVARHQALRSALLDALGMEPADDDGDDLRLVRLLRETP